MLTRLLTVVAVVFAALAAAAVCLCVRGRFATDYVKTFNWDPAARRYGEWYVSAQGGIVLIHAERTTLAAATDTNAAVARAGASGTHRAYRVTAPSRPSYGTFFWYEHKRPSPTPASSKFRRQSPRRGTLEFQPAFVAAVATLPPASLIAARALAVAAVDDARVATGHCVQCGYDLRASPDRCPECGAGRRARRSGARPGVNPNNSLAPSPVDAREREQDPLRHCDRPLRHGWTDQKIRAAPRRKPWIERAKDSRRPTHPGYSSAMPQRLAAVTLLVDDYDRAIAYFTGVLGFALVEDTPRGPGKRWVVVAPPGATLGAGGGHLLLARAATPQQTARVGDQTGGRIAFFLHTDDFARDYAAMESRGVAFAEAPRREAYATVAVFVDPWGNRWDFLGPPTPAT